MPRIAAAVTVVIVMGMCIGFNAVRYPSVWKMVASAHQPPRPEQPVLESQSPTFSEPGPAEKSSPPIALIPDSSSAPFSSASVDPIPFPTVLATVDDERSDEAIASSVNVASTRPGDSTDSLVWEDAGYAPHEPPAGPGDTYYVASSRHGASGYGGRETEPVEASPSMKYASGAAQPDVPRRSTLRARLVESNRRPLVPVAPATRHQYNWTPAEGNRSAKLGVGNRRTKRLDHRVQRLPSIDRTGEPSQRMREPADIDGPIPIYPSTQDR